MAHSWKQLRRQRAAHWSWMAAYFCAAIQRGNRSEQLWFPKITGSPWSLEGSTALLWNLQLKRNTFVVSYMRQKCLQSPKRNSLAGSQVCSQPVRREWKPIIVRISGFILSLSTVLPSLCQRQKEAVHCLNMPCSSVCWNSGNFQRNWGK